MDNQSKMIKKETQQNQFSVASKLKQHQTFTFTLKKALIMHASHAAPDAKSTPIMKYSKQIMKRNLLLIMTDLITKHTVFNYCTENKLQAQAIT